MSEATETQTQTKKKSKIKAFFGQFAEPQFYAELAEVAIREVMKAAALAFAGALTLHIQRRFNGGAVGYDHNNIPNNNNNSSSAASKAFGVVDTTDYTRKPYTPSYMPTAPSSSTGTFPGFGQR